MNRKLPLVERICFNCREVFLAISYRGKKICSRECFYKYQRGERHPFYGKKQNKEAIEKMRVRGKLKGEKHWNWQGGKRGKDYLERRRFQNSIKDLVLKRDDYTCQICGQRGGQLQVDHIQSWSEYIELRFNIENCRTLCQKCHYKITYGKPMPPTVRAWGHNLSKGGNIK